MLEDVTNCERIQKGLESGALDEMHLRDGEFMIRDALKVLDKWVNAPSAAEAMRS